MSSEGLIVLAVDDEQAQLNDLARLLRASPLVREVESVSDPREALARLSADRYDAVFLDVRMPGLGGIELARVIRQFRRPPALVLVSAYDNSAVDAFEVQALDYLRKPVSRRRAEEALERVAEAMSRADESMATPGGAPAPAHPPARAAAPTRAAVPTPAEGMVALSNPQTGSTHLLPRAEILYVQAQGDFVRVVAPAGRFLIRGTLSEVAERWAPHGFVRVHRQYVANLHRAREIRPHFGSTAELVMEEGTLVPIARRHLSELQHLLRP